MSDAPPAPSSIGRLVRMLDDAHRLRGVIQQNSFDQELVGAGITVHHMVDTPVFRIFAEPDRHSGIVSAFPSLFRTDQPGQTEELDGDREELTGLDLRSHFSADEVQPTLFANALLTAEYIFRIAGSAGGERLLISPEHVTEIHGYVVNLAKRAAAEGSPPRQQQTSYDAVGRWLAAETAGLGGSEEDAASWLKHVRRGLVTRLAELGASTMVAEQRLTSVFTKGRLGHAAEALHFDAGLISPPDDLVREWRLRVGKAKRFNRITPNPHALEADAVTMAQLQLFNQEAGPERRVCVLITNDIGLHRACGAWLREHQPGARPFNPLRDPRQYMPVLNVGGDNGGFTDETVFVRVRDALDQLLTSFATSDATGEGLADGLAWPDMGEIARSIRGRASGVGALPGPFAEMVSEQIANVGQAWLRLLEYSLLAKSHIVLELAGDEREIWRNVSRAVLRREMDTQVTRVTEQFVGLTQSSVLLRLEITAFNQRMLPASINRRMLVTEFTGFRSEEFRGFNLPQVVDRLRGDLDASIDGLEEADPRERLLVIGCISLAIGALPVARTLFEQARGTSDRDPLGVEVRFFQCVARRLAPGHESILAEYSDLEVVLPALLADGSGPLHNGRVRMEIVAVLLCRCAFEAFNGGSYLDALRRAVSGWRLLSEWGATRLVGEQSEEGWRALLKQFALNTFCLIFWVGEGEITAPDSLRAMSMRLLGMLEGEPFAFIGDGVHGAIYPELARYALAARDDRAAIALRVSASIRRLLEDDAAAGFAFDLPFIDRIELGHLERVLTARHAVRDESAEGAAE